MTITRYITWELIGWLAVVLVMLTFVLVLVVVAGEASRMNLGLGPTLKLLPYVLPTSLAYAAPYAMLFTICLVYGRMSADNEVVATKALGITPVVLLWPAWLLAFGLSLIGVWLTDLAFSGADVRNLLPIVDSMRVVKDADEVGRLRKAVAISVAGHVAAMRSTGIDPGVPRTEALAGSRVSRPGSR